MKSLFKQNGWGLHVFGEFWGKVVLSLLILTVYTMSAKASPPIDRQQKDAKKKYVVSGLVKDENDETLPGVTISLKGNPSLGTTTDMNGKFTWEIYQNDDFPVLVFSYVGMEKQEYKLKKTDTKNLNIVMKYDNTTMKDVVITGFGNKSKNSYTGSAASVTGEELKMAGSRNLLSSLSALVPGMKIADNLDMGSNPNALPEMYIRGRSSFDGASSVPTFIVDNVEVDLQYVFDMDINTVENITVLKDASASALYGSKAANGVVVITTKPLKAGKLQVSYNGDFGLSVPDLSDYNLLNATEKLEYERLAGLYTSTGESQYLLDNTYNEIYKRVKAGVNTDWLSKPLRNSIVQNHSINIEGGDRFVRYGVTGRYGNEQGVMKGSKRDRYSFAFKLSYSKGDQFFISNTTTISAVNNKESPYGTFGDYTKLNPYDPVYLEDGSLNKTLSYDAANPLYEATLSSFDRGEDFYINSVLNLRFQMTKDFRIEGQYSLRKDKNDTEKFTSPDSNEFKDMTDFSEKGSYEIGNTKKMTHNGRLMLSYNKIFEEGTLLSVSGGGTVESSNSNSNGYKGIGILSDRLAHPSFATKYPESEYPSGSQDLYRSLGLFATANLIYRDRYFVDGSFRYEGSSKFGKDKRYAPFWSVGGGWNIHQEKFMKSLPVERLKLRASVGYTGNTSFSPYQAMTTYHYVSDLGYSKGIGTVPITIGNPNLEWERTITYNAGLDVEMFSKRFELTFDAYKKVTDGLLLDVTKAPSVGVSTAKENVGKMQNIGLELSATVVPIRQKDWNWALRLTLQHNKNKIVKISNALKALNEQLNADPDKTLPPPLYEEGQSTTAVKAVKSGGIDPLTGQEIYFDLNGNPTFIYNYWDKCILGDTEPSVEGTIGSYLTYKGFSLNLLFGYSLDATVYNQTLVTRVEGTNPKFNADKRVFTGRWRNPGDHAKYKDIADTTVPKVTSRFIEDESYLKMTNMTLGYEFPENIYSKMKLRRLRLEFKMNDVFRISTVKQERGLSYPYAWSYDFSISTAF